MAENDIEVLEVPIEIAIQVKLSEFDKAIADAEFSVADLKKQKATFIHEQNILTVKNKYQKTSV